MKYCIKIISLLICVHALSGCLGGNPNNEKHSESMHDADSSAVENESCPFIDMTRTPFDLNEVKRKFEHYSTSGMIPKSQSAIYKVPADNGFFGGYCLITEDSDIVGALTVYAFDYPWRYYNDTDIFIEICTVSEEITLWDSIRVGMDVDKLKSFLGAPLLISKEFYVYKKESNLIALFKHNDSKVTWLRIGHYSDELWNNIDSQWKSLFLKSFI